MPTKRSYNESEYKMGDAFISINDCPQIVVKDLKFSMAKGFYEVEDPIKGFRHIESKEPTKIYLTFKIPSHSLSKEQIWFFEFNNSGMINSHLERSKIIIHMGSDKFSLIGFLQLTGHMTEHYDSFMEFGFTGTQGDNLNLVPDPYSDIGIDALSQGIKENFINSIPDPLEEMVGHDPEAPTAEEWCETFELADKAIAEKVLKEIQRKITF